MNTHTVHLTYPWGPVCSRRLIKDAVKGIPGRTAQTGPLAHRLLGMSWKSWPSSHPAFIIIFPWDPGFASDPETCF